jgi:hypothetical protein
MIPESGVMLFPLARRDTLVQGDFAKSIEAAAMGMTNPVVVKMYPSPLTIVDLTVALGAKQFHPL